MLAAPPRAQPDPSPALGSGSGNSCAGGTEKEPIPAVGLGHGASSDLDPREGGILAERWVGPRAELGLRVTGMGRGKGKRTC